MDKEIKISTYDNKDDIDEAIRGLDIFTKNYCMNVKETEEKNDLIFRCKECPFNSKERCLVKIFAHNNSINYDLNNFGSMGSH